MSALLPKGDIGVNSNPHANSTRCGIATILIEIFAITICALTTISQTIGVHRTALANLHLRWREFDRILTMKTEKLHEGWRALWLTIAGVIVIMLIWNVAMLSLNGISY